MKEKGEANRLSGFLAKQHLGRRVRPKEVFPQLLLGRHDLVRSAFVLRQFVDQGEDNRDVVPVAPGESQNRIWFSGKTH